MSYNSKYEGEEVERLLDSIGNKVDKEDLSGIISSIEQQIATKQDKITDLQTIREGAAKGATAIQSHQDISGKLDKTEAASTYLSKTEASSTYLGKTAKAADSLKADSATKATQDGSGNNIVNTYATKNELNGKGTYSKPSTGIPKSDLASAVQSSLNKADTALQNEQYKGTVTSVKINGTTKTPDTNGMVDLGTIEGGGSSSGGSGAYAEVNHGTSDTTFTLTPNTFHVWDEVASLDLSFANEQAGVANEFLFQFTSGATPTTLTLPDDIKWANDTTSTISANKTYQISVLKGFGSVLEFKGIYEKFLIDNTEYYVSNNMTWVEWINSPLNIDNYALHNGKIVDKSFSKEINDISVNDIIKPNYKYTLVIGGAGPT